MKKKYKQTCLDTVCGECGVRFGSHFCPTTDQYFTVDAKPKKTRRKPWDTPWKTEAAKLEPRKRTPKKPVTPAAPTVPSPAYYYEFHVRREDVPHLTHAQWAENDFTVREKTQHTYKVLDIITYFKDGTLPMRPKVGGYIDARSLDVLAANGHVVIVEPFEFGRMRTK